MILSPALGVVVQTIDHGTVAFLQHRPAVAVLLVCLHQDAEEEHHTPIPAAFQGYIELCSGSHVERRRRDEEDKVHPHVLVVAAQWPAVYELVAEEVFVSNIKAGKDVDPCPFVPPSSTIVTSFNVLHAPHKPSDVTVFELVVFPVAWREPKATKPVTAKVVQIIGNFLAEIFEGLVFSYVRCIPCI